eukprot:TRINITY_DN2797_c0_g2_i1.p1 TRINITY_DN2797_c0_g2~~TRINITY_DN2797_c0_g2_i1.p1  ORF type:complete len:163 (+),score=33.21 TRINITY_DN2797_c0_g2_i1:113-601(+)
MIIFYYFVLPVEFLKYDADIGGDPERSATVGFSKMVATDFAQSRAIGAGFIPLPIDIYYINRRNLLRLQDSPISSYTNYYPEDLADVPYYFPGRNNYQSKARGFYATLALMVIFFILLLVIGGTLLKTALDLRRLEKKRRPRVVDEDATAKTNLVPLQNTHH